MLALRERTVRQKGSYRPYIAKTPNVCSGVINGPDGPEIGLPLSPRKRTQVGHRTMPGSCEDRTCGPPHRDPLMAASEAIGGERATSVIKAKRTRDVYLARGRNRASPNPLLSGISARITPRPSCQQIAKGAS